MFILSSYYEIWRCLKLIIIKEEWEEIEEQQRRHNQRKPKWMATLSLCRRLTSVVANSWLWLFINYKLWELKKLTHSVLNRGGQDKPQLHLISYRLPILILTAKWMIESRFSYLNLGLRNSHKNVSITQSFFLRLDENFTWANNYFSSPTNYPSNKQLFRELALDIRW